jgi:serine/threonine protein phosphatase 1
MQCLRNQFSCGDFLFVHAGIRPDIPIEQQDVNDLIWIPDEFLESTREITKDSSCTVTRRCRIRISGTTESTSTPRVANGNLTCIAIEGSTILFL